MATQKTSTQWSVENPILTNGELGLESDTSRVKLGDGVRTWTSLPYFASGVGIYNNLANQPTVSQELGAATGYLLGGMITTSVAGGNLTVSIKTLSNKDPSAGEPVTIRIGSFVGRIIAPLSLTLASGTNHMRVGTSLFAGQEMDFFVYMGRRLSDDSLFLGLSRFPYYTTAARSADSVTAEKRLACSGEAPALASPIENIGRISAKLSAAYAWTLSTEPIVQHPINTTRTLPFVPTMMGPAILSGYSQAVYKLFDSFVKVDFYADNRTLSGAAGTIDVSLPVNIQPYTITKYAILNATGAANIVGLLQMFPDRMAFNKGSTFASFSGNETAVYLRCNEIFSVE